MVELVDLKIDLRKLSKRHQKGDIKKFRRVDVIYTNQKLQKMENKENEEKSQINS